MTPSELMKALSDAGASFEAILIAVQALEAKDAEIAARDAEVAERRAKDAERKRLARSVSTDIPRTDHGQSEPIPSPSLSPQTPQTHPHPCNKPRTRKGTRLQADWQPLSLPKELTAAVARWPDGALDRELARFRDWAASATGTVAVKTDWDAAWRNWLRKADEDGRHFRKPAVPANDGSFLDHLIEKKRRAEQWAAQQGP